MAGRDEGDLGDKTWACWNLAENGRKQLEAVGCKSEVVALVMFGLPLADAAPQFFFPKLKHTNFSMKQSELYCSSSFIPNG